LGKARTGVNGLRRIAVVLMFVFMVGAAQLNEVDGKPRFRYVEFNGERKWPGQTHIVPHGTVLGVVAALEEPYKQSMTADLIFIDENGDARIERMERINADGNREWHAYDMDTSTLNPGTYTVRIEAVNAAREGNGEQEELESEKETWGYLTLRLEAQQTPQPQPKIPGYPLEASIMGLLGAIFTLVYGRKRKEV
jgi:hypothetical protein